MMKTIFKLLCCLLISSNNVFCQPKVCINPPVGYEHGGDFEITTFDGGLFQVDDFLCLPEKSAVGRIGVINTSNFTPNTIRYIFGVDNATTIPVILPFIKTIDLDGQSKGEFWVMQVGEENNKKKLNCKKIQIAVSDRPQLDISSCDNQSFTLKLNTTEPIDYYMIDWKDGSISEKINFKNTEVFVQHKFIKNSGEPIEVKGFSEMKTINRTCGSVPVKINTPPAIHIESLKMQDNATHLAASFSISAPNNFNLNLLLSEDAGATFTALQKVNTPSFQIPNLPKKQLCFKLNNSFNANCTYDSEPVCAINPNIDNSVYGQLGISWNNIATNTMYEINRLGVNPINLKNISNTKYIDKDIQCNQSNDYQVEGKYNDNNGNAVFVSSVIVNSNTKFHPSLVPNQLFAVSVLNDGKPHLEILNPVSPLTYIVLRSTNGEPFKKIYETQHSQFTDSVNAHDQLYCYAIQYKDACNIVSDTSPAVCTIFLERNLRELQWNKPTEFTHTDVSYEVRRKEPQETLSVQANTQYQIKTIERQKEKYEIVATIKMTAKDSIYIVKSVSNTVEIDYSVNVYFPEAFTPNNDNLNDEFVGKANSEYIKIFEMKIYNQWGNLIFESNDINQGWNGKVDNQDATMGSYLVKLNYQDIFGFKHSSTERLNLLR